MDDGQGYHSFLAKHEHVQRVIIFSESLWQESVVRRIVDGGVKNSVQANQAARLVEFVLHASAVGNFDHRIEFLREFVTRSDIMPRMNHRIFYSSGCDRNSDLRMVNLR